MAIIPSFDDIKVIDEKGYWSPEYKPIIQLLFSSLQNNIGNEGFIIPSLSSINIEQLNNSIEGSLVYNIDTKMLMLRVNETWISLDFVPYTIPISQGGTGETTQQAALTILSGEQISGSYLRSDGSNTFLQSIVASDVPILNQDTTGIANHANNISGGMSGQIPYQTAPGDTGFLNSLDNSILVTDNDGNPSFMTVLPEVESGSTIVTDPTTSNLNNLNATLSNITSSIPPVEYPISIDHGGTGQITRQAAMNALSGSTTSGQYPRGDGTNVIMSSIQAADVPILNQDSTGTSQFATNIKNGNANDIPYQTSSNTTSFIFSANNSVLATNGSGVPSMTSTLPSVISGYTIVTNPVIGGPTSLNTSLSNIYGSIPSVIYPIQVSDGGTGQTTQQSAINALSGSTTSGQYLRGNGTNVIMSSIQAADVPTLNQNTTGTSSNVTGIVTVPNGGTGLNTLTTSYGVICAGTTATGNLQNTGVGTSGQVLTSNGSDSLPSFQTIPSTYFNLIDRKSVSGVNTVTLSGLSSGYWYKLFYILTQLPSVNSTPRLGFNSITSASYYYTSNYSIYNSSGQSGSNLAPITFFPLVNGTSDPLDNGSSTIGEFIIYQKGIYIHIQGQRTYKGASGLVAGISSGYLLITPGSTLSNIQIYQAAAGATFDCVASIYEINY